MYDSDKSQHTSYVDLLVYLLKRWVCYKVIGITQLSSIPVRKQKTGLMVQVVGNTKERL